ncbi:hypothetical protein [Fulvivirga ligni]|uniref:hypothetical protein n=1 Tax=Fulvivirga ligni TaxID=2904246 RepID=UPI001F433437|nr:hypothetical protein [Fulvivirga ligni]UII21513.1 hypothetical protein LVD16_27170 [Fulvivirga ligni]
METKRHYEAEYNIENVRNTQLYRTLPHEFGHYKHFLKEVEDPGSDDEPFEEWEKRYDSYFSIPSATKEQFAHQYADKLRKKLEESRVIPFERIEDKPEC